MAFPNVSDIVATTIQNRSRSIADNVTKNNALLARLNQRGNVKPFAGGSTILQELSFAENGNAGFYSGYDTLPVAAQDVISASEWSIKQLACPVVISGLEMLQNSGREQFIDLLEEFPSARPSAQELIESQRRLMPRLYSIASSPALHPQEIHLTVAVVRYETNGRRREGVCSTYLADRARMGEADLPVFVAESHFGLPADDSVPIIMVGPGTGVAPFRSFVQDRAARGVRSPAWLFFGDQRKDHDFLYADEWAGHLKSGALTRLDTAFSRDQEAKVYVQDRMRENAAELWKWLSGGAAFYVCGDAKRMAKDVDAALHAIVAEQGGMTPEAAVEWVKQLKKDGRYQRDVY